MGLIACQMLYMGCHARRHDTEPRKVGTHHTTNSNTDKEIVATYNVLLGIHALRHLTIYNEVHARTSLAQIPQAM